LGFVATSAWGSVGLDLTRYTSFNPHFSVDPMVYPRLTWLVTLGPQALALLAAGLSAVWPAMVAARREVSQGMREL
jgi:hypothetical protein